MSRLSLKAAPLVLALAAAGFGGAAGNALLQNHANAANPPAATAAAPVAPVPAASSLPDFARITEKYGPAVVNISVSGMRKASAADLGDDDDPADFLRRF